MLKVFSIYDSVAVAYLKPFYSENAGTAIRDFTRASLDESSPFFRNAADYQLVLIGTFEEFSGNLIPEDPKVFLGSALEFIASARSESSVSEAIKGGLRDVSHD